MANRGGKRKGAGRKPLPDAERKSWLIRALVTPSVGELIDRVAHPSVSEWAAEVLERAARHAQGKARSPR